MKVYWINVYDDHGIGGIYTTPWLASLASKDMLIIFGHRTIYRIKVTMKA